MEVFHFKAGNPQARSTFSVTLKAQGRCFICYVLYFDLYRE